MHLTSVYVTKIPLCECRLDLNHFVYVGLPRGFATSLGFSSNYAFLKFTAIKDNPCLGLMIYNVIPALKRLRQEVMHSRLTSAR